MKCFWGNNWKLLWNCCWFETWFEEWCIVHLFWIEIVLYFWRSKEKIRKLLCFVLYEKFLAWNTSDPFIVPPNLVCRILDVFPSFSLSFFLCVSVHFPSSLVILESLMKSFVWRTFPILDSKTCWIFQTFSDKTREILLILSLFKVHSRSSRNANTEWQSKDYMKRRERSVLE